MKIVLTADLHGTLPQTDKCDLLIIAGDICPMENHNTDFQLKWLDQVFAPWLKSQPALRVVGIAGNHDFVFQKAPAAVAELCLPWTYLQDSLTQVGELKVYGTPWTPNLPMWAFNDGTDSRVPKYHWEAIPRNLDILVSHGPMHGYGDRVFGGWEVGCRNMEEMITYLNPTLLVCGHIHEGYGYYYHHRSRTHVYNVSHMNETYEPVNKPVSLEWKEQRALESK